MRLQTSVISGHKADFGLMLMDPDPLKIDGVHQRLMSGPAGPALTTGYSYVSVTEISEYVPSVEDYAKRVAAEGDPEGTPAHEAKVKAYAGRLGGMNRQRLTPEFPPYRSCCFYPMNKKRKVGENWFTLSKAERNQMMSEHARSGMAFAGKVSQLITVSLGLDDWEWGVTLWASSPEYLKDVVYQMRFDEASARYAEFGPFLVGYVCDAAGLSSALSSEKLTKRSAWTNPPEPSFLHADPSPFRGPVALRPWHASTRPPRCGRFVEESAMFSAKRLCRRWGRSTVVGIGIDDPSPLKRPPMNLCTKSVLATLSVVVSLVAASGPHPGRRGSRVESNDDRRAARHTSLQNPGMASRTMAMMNLAIYDAFAMTSSDGTMFYNYGQGHQSPGLSASTDAAAAQAAYTVLSSIYPDQQASLDWALTASLGGVADSQAKTDGVVLGAQIGAAIVASRANDGYDTNEQYMPTNEPGHWQVDPLNPDQEAWGPSWGDVTPFAVQSGTQFMPPPMPDLTSQEYTDAFNEVKALGAKDSATRTDEQTEVGVFWAYDRLGMGTPMRLYNQAMQNIAVQEGNTSEENAKLFAKASVAVADAGITAWNSKFEFDFWRPVTGIREADTDGNPDTIADEDWTPLGAPGGTGNDFTPPFPTYLSGHATFGGALFGALQEFYGTDDIAFSLTSEELALAGYADDERFFQSLSEAMAENGRSRVYLGIHWNFDDTEAQITGAQVANYVFSSPFIASVPEPSSAAVLAMLGGLAIRRRRRR